MFYREVITVLICVRHINTLDGQNVEFFNMKSSTYDNHLALKSLRYIFVFTPTV